VIVVYIAALVAALGVVALQIFSGHGDTAGHDVHGADHDNDGFGTFFASLRFWSFLLLAFGLVGTMLTLFHLAGPIVTFVLALGSGAISGVFAVSVIRRLLTKSASSNVRVDDVIGKIGRVIVPLATAGRGKVRVEIKGSMVDYVARADESLDEGESIIVEEVDGSEVVVIRAPKELKSEN
jgi:membrane protein implicated in regulation of membrane protease activity